MKINRLDNFSYFYKVLSITIFILFSKFDIFSFEIIKKFEFKSLIFDLNFFYPHSLVQD